MIIKAKPLTPFFFKFGAIVLGFYLKRKFNKLIIRDIPIKPGHSYLLMCNHCGFLDGIWAYYLCNKVLWKKNGMKRLYIMSLKKQMEINKWLRYCGSFSVDPGKRSVRESFAYAAEVLSEPGNLLLFYPQAKLESCHVRNIHFEDGIKEIIPKIKSNCQLIWSSNLIEYFESTKPSLYFNMLDCETNQEFDFESLKQKVNSHHKQSMEKNVRFTKAPFQ
jgi:hypothetical protein